MESFDYMITAIVEDLPTSLQRVMSLLRRKRITVKQLNITDGGKFNLMYLQLMVKGKHGSVENLVRQLRKMFNFSNVQVSFKILGENKGESKTNRFIDFGVYSPIKPLEEQMAIEKAV